MLAFSVSGLSAPANRILLVLGQTPFPVELLDGFGRVLYCNVAYARSFLGSDVSVLDRPSRVFPSHGQGNLSQADIFALARKTGLWKGELDAPCADGSLLPVRLSVFPIHHSSDRELEYAVYYEDISAEVRAREDLAQQQRLVAIRSRHAQMGELLSMIAHQWRQPLTVVMSLIGNIQLQSELGKAGPEYLKNKLERIGQTVQHLSETIDSFRNFYAESKAKTDEDLGALVSRVLELQGPSLQKLGVAVEYVAPAKPLILGVFSGEFLQVLMELITNARDALVASGQVKPCLKLALCPSPEGVTVWVENNGGEIPQAVLPEIYDPYFSTKEGGSGTGLGLYMAQLIVEGHHGGKLDCQCDGGWTRFSCHFPAESLP